MLCQCNDLSLLIVTHIHSIILCNIYLSYATPLRVPPLRVNHFLQFNNKIDSMIWKRRGVKRTTTIITAAIHKVYGTELYKCFMHNDGAFIYSLFPLPTN